MNLSICVNHSMPQQGGSEYVVQNIAEHMTEMGIKTTIISKSIRYPINFNGIDILPAGNNRRDFFSALNSTNPDHVLVYSDYFKFWPDLLREVHNANYKTTLIPVGFNATIADPSLMGQFRKQSKNINIVTHSDNYQDYKLCKSLNIPVRVIPNGINFKELNDFDLIDSMKKKYKIDTKKVVLCVSNFFPGKGQEFLPRILEKVYKDYKDFTMVFISSTVDFEYANRLRQRFKKILLKNCSFPYKFLTDIPREDVVDFYAWSDIFVLPSQKEVAPLVILESMASYCPWVSLPVGNVETLTGGILIEEFTKDVNDNLCYSDKTYELFAASITKLLCDDKFNHELGAKGADMIHDQLNWDAISAQYYNLFTAEKS